MMMVVGIVITFVFAISLAFFINVIERAYKDE